MPTHLTKIATLNIWQYNDWDVRFPLIVDLLKKLDPDIILLQEVQRDISKNDDDQATILRKELRYPYSHFERSSVKTTRKGVSLAHPVDHGLAIISKFPFTTEMIPLSQIEKDKEARILLVAQVKTTEQHPLTISNIHLTNTDTGSQAQFKEALGILSARSNSILAGDFNIKRLTEHRDLYTKNYVASSDTFPYISYPQDGLTYDHILIPPNCTFRKFQCREETVSDHKLLYAEIDWNY